MFRITAAPRGRFPALRVLLGSTAAALASVAATPTFAQTAGDDRVVNTVELTIAANSDFGAGSDLFTNRGIIKFAKAPAPLNLSFLNLEGFISDGGLVDLRNERGGDSLTLTGAYAGSGNARLALDIGPTAIDRLVVQGAATGKTYILLQARPEDATLMAAPVSLVTVGAGSTAGAFVLPTTDIGLVRYNLTYDSTARAYMLDASAGRSVHQSVRAGEGLTTAWRASADAFNAEQALARAAGGDRGRIWAQVHGSMTDRDGGEADPTLRLGYEQEVFGVQAGVSLGARPLFGGEAAFGLTGGKVDSDLSFDGGRARADLITINGGGYGAWRRGNLFATGLVKIDQHDLEIRDQAAGFRGELEGVSWGAQGVVGYRFAFGGIAFEPTAGLEYLSSTLDDLEVLGQSVSFEDHQGLAARFGGQAMARVELIEGGAVTWTAGLEAVHDFETDRVGTLHSKGQTDEVRVEGPQGYSRAQVGVQFEAPGGLETYVQGEARFGEVDAGGGVRIGARYRF